MTWLALANDLLQVSDYSCDSGLDGDEFDPEPAQPLLKLHQLGSEMALAMGASAAYECTSALLAVDQAFSYELGKCNLYCLARHPIVGCERWL